MRILTLTIMTLILSGCGHTALKAPCGPSASLGAHPCTPIPLNVAAGLLPAKQTS